MAGGGNRSAGVAVVVVVGARLAVPGEKGWRRTGAAGSSKQKLDAGLWVWKLVSKREARCWKLENICLLIMSLASI